MKKENTKLVQVDEEYLKNLVGTTEFIKHTDDGKIIGTLDSDGYVEMDLKSNGNTLKLGNLDSSKLTEMKIKRSIRIHRTHFDRLLDDISDLNLIKFVSGAKIVGNSTLDKSLPVEHFSTENDFYVNTIQFVLPVNDRYTPTLSGYGCVKVITHYHADFDFETSTSIYVDTVIPLSGLEEDCTYDQVLCFKEVGTGHLVFILTAERGYMTTETVENIEAGK